MPVDSDDWEDNLPVREKPGTGFFVEGLKVLFYLRKGHSLVWSSADLPQEYVVRAYDEAKALLNLGLENRALAPTLMNSTSSRSHTVLTVVVRMWLVLTMSADVWVTHAPWQVEQRGKANDDKAGVTYSRTLRGKLLLVDLAGSERVRRTTSR